MPKVTISYIFSLIFLLVINQIIYSQTCSDGILNGDETGIDCGGSCGGAPIHADICNALTVDSSWACFYSQNTDCGYLLDVGGCNNSAFVGLFYRLSFDSMFANAIRVHLSIADSLNNKFIIAAFKDSCQNPTLIHVDSSFDSTLAFIIDNYSYLFIGTPFGLPATFDVCFEQIGIAETPIEKGPYDCDRAVHVCCNNQFFFIRTDMGNGNQELANNFNSCIPGGESNSSWFTFNTADSGVLGFDLVAKEDYDWTLYDITEGGCEGILTLTSPVIRCNASDSIGNTGMRIDSYNTGFPENVDSSGSNYSSGFITQSNRKYALVVNNKLFDTSSFYLKIRGASIYDSLLPNFDSAFYSYKDSTIIIYLDEKVDCYNYPVSAFLLTNTDSVTDYTFVLDSSSLISCGETPIEKIVLRLNEQLPEGNYRISLVDYTHVIDLCGNEANDTLKADFEVNICNEFSFSLKTDNVKCYGNNTGSVILTKLKGSPPFDISLTPGVDSLALYAGTYFISVIDSNGCTQTQNFTISQPDSLSLTLDITNVNCNGDNTGMVSWQPEGGTPPYSIDFPYDSTALVAGEYFLTVTDSVGCSSIDTFMVQSPDSFIIYAKYTLDSITELAQITIEKDGGMDTILYSIDSINWQKNNVFNNITQGNYVLYGLDQNGCVAVDSIAIVMNGFGLVEQRTLMGTIVYPNPSKSAINIVFIDQFQTKNIEIELYDPLGKKMNVRQTKSNNKVLIDITRMDMGVYYLLFKDNSGVLGHSKIIVQK